MRFIAILMAATLLVSTAFAAEDPVAVRVRFGVKDKEGQDWSGKLALSQGSVQSMRGWRWMPGDKAETGADGGNFTIATRRAQAQSRADRQRIAAGGKMPIQENGFIATLAGATNDTEITFDAAPGETSLKLSDIPFGKSHEALDGNVIIDRVPAATELAGTNADEDYPAAARAKDGTLYVAYLAFTHGKDFQGARERPATPDSGPVADPGTQGRIRKIEKPEDLNYLAQPTGGEQIFLRIRKPDGAWGEPIAVTDGKLELYRPAIALDGSGKVWVFYSAHEGADKNLDHGNWELMARSFDAAGANGGNVINVSKSAGPDFMPAAATDSSGKAWVTWIGGRDANFNVFVAGQNGDGFGAPQRVTKAAANEWDPAIAAGSDGQVTVAWDTYEKGDYDVYYASRQKDGSFAAPQPVAASLAFEVRPSLAYDKENQLWIAWEESGDMWGKDWGALKKKGIALYNTGRSIAVKMLKPDGKWFAPPDVMEAASALGNPGQKRRPRSPAADAQPAGAAGSVAPSYPRLATDSSGHVWIAFRGKTNWRVPVGSVWFEYVTRLEGDRWTDAIWLPRSSDVLDNRPAVVGEDGKLTLVYTGDGRGEANPAKPGSDLGATDSADAAGQPDDEAAAANAAPAGRGGRRANRQRGEINADLFTASISAKDYGPSERKPAALKEVEPAKPAAIAADTQADRKAIRAIQDYRINVNGEALRIWRGEFHRHTELSPDGAGDGGLLDMWRYGIDAADLDWIGDGDHDYGTGREYSWWKTQKAVTLFTLKNEFVPLYCYERSVSYPEGHRNCMFAKRGIRSLPRLPITSPDEFKPAPDTKLLYMYLHHFDGLCASHTSATDMGTDWRDNDPKVEPFVEIYQGDRNNYERPDSPRSAVTEAKLKQSTPEKESLGGWQPKGFVNLALKMGYKLAFQASSDHISTHLSYCNVLIPADKEPTREAVIEAIKKRRVYGATDNLIADFRCKSSDGKEHIQGEEFTTGSAPTFSIRLIGPQKFVKVTIIKDDEEVHIIEPKTEDVNFTWTDPKPSPAGKTSYYYVRGDQAPDMDGITSGELVWASPMWITVESK